VEFDNTSGNFCREFSNSGASVSPSSGFRMFFAGTLRRSALSRSERRLYIHPDRNSPEWALQRVADAGEFGYAKLDRPWRAPPHEGLARACLTHRTMGRRHTPSPLRLVGCVARTLASWSKRPENPVFLRQIRDSTGSSADGPVELPRCSLRGKKNTPGVEPGVFALIN